MNPRVKNVKPNKDYTLELEFADSTLRLFDMNPYLNFGIFKELQNLNYFYQVKCLGGTIAWPNGQDVCPDTLFIESKCLTKHYT